MWFNLSSMHWLFLSIYQLLKVRTLLRSETIVHVSALRLWASSLLALRAERTWENFSTRAQRLCCRTCFSDLVFVISIYPHNLEGCDRILGFSGKRKTLGTGILSLDSISIIKQSWGHARPVLEAVDKDNCTSWTEYLPTVANLTMHILSLWLISPTKQFLSLDYVKNQRTWRKLIHEHECKGDRSTTFLPLFGVNRRQSLGDLRIHSNCSHRLNMPVHLGKNPQHTPWTILSQQSTGRQAILTIARQHLTALLNECQFVILPSFKIISDLCLF